jgi:O-antigen/teichoic acid export membrane protein
MGIYFNLSFWYKLIDETRWGAYFSFIGCAILVTINIVFIPIYGYMACAWAGFAGYGIAMLLSYFVGQKKYPINYDMRRIGVYVVSAISLYSLGTLVPISNIILLLAFRTVLLFLFIALIIKKDMPLKELPYVGRYFRH